MDISHLKNGSDEGTWYTLPGTEVQIKIRQPRPKEHRDMRKKCMKLGVRPAVGGAVNMETDEDQVLEMLLLLCVVDWKNIEFDGKELPVTDENKRFLNDTWTLFTNYWQAVYSKGVKEGSELVEIELGNLPSGAVSI